MLTPPARRLAAESSTQRPPTTRPSARWPTATDRRPAAAVRAPHPDAAGLRAGLLLPFLAPVPGVWAAGRSRAAGDGAPGDFLDVFPTAPDRWGLVLGDVCGHDAEAAALAGWARAAVREAAGARRTPRGVLGLLNRRMLDETSDSERFLTAIYLDLRPTRDGLRVALCSAGHLPALVRRQDGAVLQVSSSGIVLGVTKSPRIAETRLLLRPGDTVLLYTDGVTEAYRDGDRYGEARLLRLFSRIGHREPAVVARAIEHAALDFGDTAHRDDLTLAVLRVT